MGWGSCDGEPGEAMAGPAPSPQFAHLSSGDQGPPSLMPCRAARVPVLPDLLFLPLPLNSTLTPQGALGNTHTWDPCPQWRLTQDK